MHAVARGRDMHGRPSQVVGAAEVARCLQHETDHLDGVLFLDRMDQTTRKQALRDIRRAPWAEEAEQPRVKLSPHPLRRPGR